MYELAGIAIGGIICSAGHSVSRCRLAATRSCRMLRMSLMHVRALTFAGVHCGN